MNVQHVISDLTGLTGLAVLDAIVAGERDPAALAKLRDPRIKAEKLVAAFEPREDPDEKPMPEDRKQKQRKRKKKSGSPDFNMRAEAYQLFGADLTQAYCRALRFLAWAVPRQRHQWRKGLMAGRTPD